MSAVNKVSNKSGKRTRITDRLVELREKNKLTHRELAKKLGVTTDMIKYYEAGVASPDLNFLFSLAKIFKVDLHQLITGEPSPAITIEVEVLRELKHKYRVVYGEVGQRLSMLKTIDRHLTIIDQNLNSVLLKSPKTKE